jgi:AraC family transcriptional regulator
MDKPDGITRLAQGVIGTIDEPEAVAERLAREAARSRTQYFRVFRALADETPGAMRRRLLLERAAWQLGRTRQPITDIALDAHYGSLEAFTRAFRRAFGVSPSLYRRMGVTHYCLAAANAIHFGAPASAQGGDAMDLFDIFAGADSFHLRRLLEHSRPLTDAQLDAPLKAPVHMAPWPTPARSLRDLLLRMVQTKEVWTAALTGGTVPDTFNEPREVQTPDALLQRLTRVDESFTRVLSDVRDRNAWSDTFVDALCEPPEKFTFGGMFAHIVTFNTCQRMLALDALRSLGVKIDGFGDPMEYEASIKVTS